MIFNVAFADYNRQPKDVILFLETWKKLHGYTNQTIDFQQCIELLRIITHEQRVYDMGVKDTVIELDSLIFAHDGDEPIEVVFYEVVQALKKKLFLKKIELKNGNSA